MLSEEKLKDRIKYIGASEAAAVLGMSRWDTQLSVWARKTGMLIPEDKSDETSIMTGNELEELVAKIFCKKTGKKVHRVNETLYHKDYPFLACNLDRRVVGENALLQCKTCSAWKAKEWQGEDIPNEYLIQEYHEMAVSGYKMAYIAVLIGNQDFQMKQILWDDDIINSIIKKEVSFWNDFIKTKIMPMQIQAADSDILYSLFPISDPNKDIILPDTATALIETLEANQAELIALERQIEESKNILKAYLGEAESGQAGKYRITWRNQIQKRIDSEKLKESKPDIYIEYLKEIKSRVLRYSKKEK